MSESNVCCHGLDITSLEARPSVTMEICGGFMPLSCQGCNKVIYKDEDTGKRFSCNECDLNFLCHGLCCGKHMLSCHAKNCAECGERIEIWPYQFCRESCKDTPLHKECVSYHLLHNHITPKLDTLFDVLGYIPGFTQAQKAKEHFLESSHHQ